MYQLKCSASPSTHLHRSDRTELPWIVSYQPSAIDPFSVHILTVATFLHLEPSIVQCLLELNYHLWVYCCYLISLPCNSGHVHIVGQTLMYMSTL